MVTLRRKAVFVSLTSVALLLAFAVAPTLAKPPPTLSGETVVGWGEGPPSDIGVDCLAPAPFLQWSTGFPAGVYGGEEVPSPYHGEFSETGRTWRVGLQEGFSPPPAPEGSDPQIRVELSDADGLRFRGVESGGDGGLYCHHYIIDWYDFSANPTYMVKIYTSNGTYVDRGTSSLRWRQEFDCCRLFRSFEEHWQSSLAETVPAMHVSSSATADRVIANVKFGSPSSRLHVHAHSSPTGETPVGTIRIKQRKKGTRHQFVGSVTCLDVLDGNVGILANTARYRNGSRLDGGGALIHLQDGGTLDRVDVSMLSATDFARQQAVGCAPITEPSLAVLSGRVTVIDALP